MLRSLALVLTLAALPAMADPSGRIEVVDADTIRVGGETVRLHGIDAPEIDQTCTRPNGSVWRCGAWAADSVRQLYQGRRASCTTVDRDRYGRTVARCRVGKEDMGADLVSRGLATAFLRYSDAYVEVEKEAMIAGRGIFSSALVPPSEHRATRAAPQPEAPGRCVIKGNISDGGRIYHLPGQENYDRTRISPERGERWFCTEAEARAAGWRRARR